jgi:hypothetical protein
MMPHFSRGVFIKVNMGTQGLIVLGTNYLLALNPRNINSEIIFPISGLLGSMILLPNDTFLSYY